MSFCEFCEEFSTGVCPALSPPRGRVLFESDDFVVFPPLGSFVEGYLMLAPRAHVPSCASLGEAQLGKLQNLLGVTKRIVADHYESPVVFEHGVASCDRRAGGCIDHAHLHIIPGRIDSAGVLARHFRTESLGGWSDLAAWQGLPYLLTQTGDGPVVVAAAPDNLPSQFLRRHAAAALNVPDLWDWGAYLGLREIEATLNRLRPVFGRDTGLSAAI